MTFSCCFTLTLSKLFRGFWSRQCYKLLRTIFLTEGFFFVTLRRAFWLWVRIFKIFTRTGTFYVWFNLLCVGTTFTIRGIFHAFIFFSSVSTIFIRPFCVFIIQLFWPKDVTAIIRFSWAFPTIFILAWVCSFHVIIVTWQFLALIVYVTALRRSVF